MNIEEVIEQLESLQMHCKDFVDKEDDCIWERDVQALGKAIELLEKEIPRKIYHKQWNGIDGVPYDLCPNCKTNRKRTYQPASKIGSEKNISK